MFVASGSSPVCPIPLPGWEASPPLQGLAEGFAVGGGQSRRLAKGKKERPTAMFFLGFNF